MQHGALFCKFVVAVAIAMGRKPKAAAGQSIAEAFAKSGMAAPKAKPRGRPAANVSVAPPELKADAKAAATDKSSRTAAFEKVTPAKRKEYKTEMKESFEQALAPPDPASKRQCLNSAVAEWEKKVLNDVLDANLEKTNSGQVLADSLTLTQDNVERVNDDETPPPGPADVPPDDVAPSMAATGSEEAVAESAPKVDGADGAMEGDTGADPPAIPEEAKVDGADGAMEEDTGADPPAIPEETKKVDGTDVETEKAEAAAAVAESAPQASLEEAKVDGADGAMEEDTGAEPPAIPEETKVDGTDVETEKAEAAAAVAESAPQASLEEAKIDGADVAMEEDTGADPPAIPEETKKVDGIDVETEKAEAVAAVAESAPQVSLEEAKVDGAAVETVATVAVEDPKNDREQEAAKEASAATVEETNGAPELFEAESELPQAESYKEKLFQELLEMNERQRLSKVEWADMHEDLYEYNQSLKEKGLPEVHFEVGTATALANSLNACVPLSEFMTWLWEREEKENDSETDDDPLEVMLEKAMDAYVGDEEGHFMEGVRAVRMSRVYD